VENVGFNSRVERVGAMEGDSFFIVEKMSQCSNPHWLIFEKSVKENDYDGADGMMQEVDF